MYYVFYEIKYEKLIIKTPTGVEMEDVTIPTQAWFLSQNALLAFLLELKAKQEEFEREINQLIGIVSDDGLNTEEELEKEIKKWKEEKKKRSNENKIKNIRKIKKTFLRISNIFDYGFIFSKFGPYESNFKDRITGLYLTNLMRNYYIPHVVKYLLEEAGVGK
jgi:hypothetical protein